MRTEYKTIDTSTLKGLKAAERLHTNGWKMARQGMFSIQDDYSLDTNLPQM